MIDPYTHAIDQVITLITTEAEQAKQGSRFADEARWTASDAAIEQLLVEHFATTGEPDAQRAWVLLSILMEQDERRTIENSDDVLFRTDITDDDVLTAWRALLRHSDNPARERAAMYHTVIIERAQVGDDGQSLDHMRAMEIGQQIQSAIQLGASQLISAQRN